MLYIVYYLELLERGVQKMNCLGFLKDPATKQSEESLYCHRGQSYEREDLSIKDKVELEKQTKGIIGHLKTSKLEVVLAFSDIYSFCILYSTCTVVHISDATALCICHMDQVLLLNLVPFLAF